MTTRTTDYRAEFDRSDRALNGGDGESNSRNVKGELAWVESYLLLAYTEMYRATGDRAYLRRLVTHFDRVLKNRDDLLGLPDAYAGKPLAGWGSDAYSDGKWHAWIVHTGMILLGPAAFVRLVSEEKALREEFGAKATAYRARIEECVRDAEPHWRDGPGKDEGRYLSPHLNAVLPLNQQNALGLVLIDLARATGNRGYREKVRRLATFHRNRLRTGNPDWYDWAYWPKEAEDGPNSEDISHASLNIEFVARCVASRIVFTRADAARFARTWLRRVKRDDGTWADTVGGGGKGNTHIPGAGSLWLGLCPVLPRSLRAEYYGDIARAFDRPGPFGANPMLGIARLLRFRPTISPTNSKENQP